MRVCSLELVEENGHSSPVSPSRLQFQFRAVVEERRDQELSNHLFPYHVLGTDLFLNLVLGTLHASSHLLDCEYHDWVSVSQMKRLRFREVIRGLVSITHLSKVDSWAPDPKLVLSASFCSPALGSRTNP